MWKALWQKGLSLILAPMGKRPPLCHASPFLPARVSHWRLVGFVDEDECGPLHNGRAGAHEGDMDILDLAFTSPS